MILSLIGPVLSFFGGKGGASVAFVAGAIAVAGWTAWWFEDEAHNNLMVESAAKIERAQANTITAVKALESANQAIQDMKDQHAKETIERARLDWEYGILKKRAEEAEAKLDGYRTRWANAATKKPGLVGGLINRATDKRVRGIEAATCRADCGEANSGGGGAGTAEEAGSNTRR